MRLQTKFGFSLTLRDGSYMESEFKNNGCYEEPESRLVLSLVRDGDFCIDAGAHVGYYSCLMALAGGHVLAIEPNPMHFAMLEENISGLHVSTSHMALSDETKDSVPFFLPSEWDDGCGTLWYTIGSDKKQRQNVFTQRLDTLLDLGEIAMARSYKNIRFLKLDIEGSELAALRGLGARMADVDYILIECGEYYAAKTIGQINEHMAGWTVKAFLDGEWRVVPKATTGNFLFVNPKVSE